ncbi:MAG: HEPN domain-containing protein [Variibacter sp.]|nr:HEPN domain-containing protein [Variibacter sp.]
MASLPRSTLQKLALAKVKDARLLFDHGRYANSYYLYGYGIELALKACIARHIVAETIPDRAILNNVLTHDIAKLSALAGLSELLRERRADREFDLRWAVVAEWLVESRYELVDSVTAAAMQDAVEHPQHGVLKWLRQHW